MLLHDLYRLIGSYQMIQVVNNERTKLLFKGYLVDIMREKKKLLNYRVNFIECDNDILYIDLDI